MRCLSLFSAGLVIALSFALAFPANSAPAKNNAAGTAVHKKSEKSAKNSSKSKSVASQRKEAKRTADRSKPQRAKQERAKQSRNDGARPKQERASGEVQAKSARDSREVWLERAKGSEILTGQASWYGKDFHKKATASGVDYDMYTFTAAHRTLPMGTIVKVTDAARGSSVMVCVTDRGPYVPGRIIDLSYAAARKLDLEERGVCKVKLEVVSDEKGAPLKPGYAYFVRYGEKGRQDKVGPFKGFADAAAMHEALSQAHPEAEVVLDPAQ